MARRWPDFAKGLLLLAIPSILPLQAGINDWEAEWKAFRAAYPYHIQVVALSKPNPSGNRLLIISEPPPTVGSDDIGAIAPTEFIIRSVAWHRMGYDGWVKDAVIELPPMTDRHLADLIDKVHSRVFGTVYKAVAVVIPDSPQFTKTGYDFDLRVPAGTLKNWLVPERQPHPGWFWPVALIALGLWGCKVFGSKRNTRHGLALLCSAIGLYFCFRPSSPGGQEETIRFTPVLGGETRTCRQLLRDRTSGVFISTRPGLVLWTVGKNTPLDRYKREARQFSLDSDILLGAVGWNDQVAIVARERVAPVALLPPLRTETILQLAAVKDAELSQSYERNHIFAGKYDGLNDWAPIYLSDALIDTEYGSLLNITDQILKSWSMSGVVRYVNFNYPDPNLFPFPQPLIKHVSATEVTFNWNTKGAGYSTNSGGFDVFAWTRTGALPVDYLGGHSARLHDAEDVAYQYFAQRHDPNLVRVVQYAELYQIFKHYGIVATAAPVTYRQGVPEVFRSALLTVLSRLRSVDDGRIRASFTPQTADGLIKCREAVAAIMDYGGQDGANKLATALAAPRLYTRRLIQTGVSMSDRSNEDAAIGRAAFGCQQYGPVLASLSGLTLDQLRQAYVKASDRETRGWIRTASIVISHPTGEYARMTGGHNLNSAITSFRATAELKPGEVRIVEENGQRILLHSESDTGRIQDTVRTIGRQEGGTEAELERKASAALANAHTDTRPLTEVLSFVEGHAPAPGRGFELTQASAYSDRTGWWVGENSISDAQARLIRALDSTQEHAIVVQRNADGGYLLFDGPSKRIVVARTQPSATDAVAAYIHGKRASAAAPVRLHLRGFEPREARGFASSTELQLAGDGEPLRLITTAERSEMAPEELKAMLTEKYNFREVKIKSISEPFVTEEGETGFHVDAEIAAANSAKPPLLVRITIMLKRGFQTTAQLLAEIRLRIMSALTSGEIQLGPDDTLLRTHAFIETLKSIHKDIGSVELKVTKEGKDLHIVRNWDAAADAGTAGQPA